MNLHIEQKSIYGCNMKIKIGTRFIGGDEPTFIIAEAGANHNRDFDMAKRLIDVAEGLVKIAECVQGNEITNLATGIPRKMEDVIRIINEHIPNTTFKKLMQ